MYNQQEISRHFSFYDFKRSTIPKDYLVQAGYLIIEFHAFVVNSVGPIMAIRLSGYRQMSMKKLPDFANDRRNRPCKWWWWSSNLDRHSWDLKSGWIRERKDVVPYSILTVLWATLDCFKWARAIFFKYSFDRKYTGTEFSRYPLCVYRSVYKFRTVTRVLWIFRNNEELNY